MSTFGSTAVGAGSGAATGAAAGSAMGPIGTAVGAGVGAVAGGVAGYFKGSAEEKNRKRKQAAWAKAQRILAEAQAKRDADSAMLMRSVYTPVNNTMVGMYGAGAGVDMQQMTAPQESTYMPSQPKGKR